MCVFGPRGLSSWQERQTKGQPSQPRLGAVPP
jgi:hypothetical protein